MVTSQYRSTIALVAVMLILAALAGCGKTTQPSAVSKPASEAVAQPAAESVPDVEPTPEPAAPETKSNTETTVYITNSGACYHSAGCSSLRKSKIPISLKDAQARGFRACGRCGR